RSDGSDQCAKAADPDGFGAEYGCWGGDDDGELGFGSHPPNPTYGATPATAVPRHSVTMSHGEDFACSLVEDPPSYSVWCWGKAQFTGQSVNGKGVGDPLPPQFNAMPLWTPATH